MRCKAALLGVVLSLASYSVAIAGPRPFVLTEDAYPDGQGALWYEQTTTFNFRTKEQHDTKEVDVEHEFEYGLTDEIDIKLAPSWHWSDTPGERGFEYDGIKLEGFYYCLNPNIEPLGVGLFANVNFGQRGLETEQGVVLQKDFDKWVLAYNLIFTTTADNLYDNDSQNPGTTTGAISNNFGAAYSVSNHLRAGAEVSVESSFREWSHYDTTTVYAGPVVNYNFGNLWITFGPDFLLTRGVKDAPQYQFNLIFGFAF